MQTVVLLREKVQLTTPIMLKPMRRAAGPPVLKAPPDPTKRPAPMEPPMAIMFKCLAFMVLFN